MDRPMDRRTFLGIVAAATALGAGPAWAQGDRGAAGRRLGPARSFRFENLVRRARHMAAEPYAPPAGPAPELLRKITYEELGRVTFRPDRALFADGGGVYPASFFLPGKFSPDPVHIFTVSGGRAREVLYAPSYFDIPDDSLVRRLPDDTGFAGFRLQESRLRDDWHTQDWVAFLGASYFRAIGALGQYGLSARGVAVDTAMPAPEDFPRFREFYIAPAEREGEPVLVHALLDGASVTGAYRFAIRRTEGVVMDVDARVFPRRDIGQLGLAPLTSMFWYAEYGRGRSLDWRPEIHDSDGLAMWTGTGERIWRPLNNPPATTTSVFADDNPRGFGLLQRDRDFGHFLDGVHYERRPSLWVEPLSAWGKGSVRCVEIPTDDEIHDNIVAFWTPAEPARRGTGYALVYRLHWLADEPYPAANIARTVATRLGRGGEPGKPRPEGVHKFVVEFAGGPLPGLAEDAKLAPVITAVRGTTSYVFTERIPGTERWRCQFDLEVEGKAPVELRLFLRLGAHAATETWLYQFHPAG
jgi:glucans biosynthesis protein